MFYMKNTLLQKISFKYVYRDADIFQSIEKQNKLYVGL